ncbi:ISAs1 family transposase, partial [Streptomyces sp. NPDC090442]|uniref:ISAs1 family transposase n=1 Tax=Streptomyces sp. NPDC090442 TaxID=3365962 RepID=UPI0037F97858
MRQYGESEPVVSPIDVAGLPALVEILRGVPDPRRRAGLRWPLGLVLVMCVVAVLCGARSLRQIWHIARGWDEHTRAVLGMSTCPETSDAAVPVPTTLGRILARIDGDALDDAIGGYFTVAAADPLVLPEDTGDLCGQGLAVDGKAVRGAVREDGRQVHLLAAATHHLGLVVAQREVGVKTNEIPGFVPLLRPLDLHGVIVTSDALHTQTGHAKALVGMGAHYLMVVKANQPKLFRQLKKLPWREVPLLERTDEKGHGRREIRRLKAVTLAGSGLRFPHTVQAIQIRRRRQDLKTGRTSTETVYAVTDLTA